MGTRTLYIAHVAGWDMILGKPALTALNALIPAGPKPVTIPPEGMARFALKEWRKAGLATGQVTSASLVIEDEAARQSSTTLRIHGLSHESRRKPGIQPLR